MKTPLIEKLNVAWTRFLCPGAESNEIQHPGHEERVQATLATTGKLAISESNLVYLDVDDNYIHHLFPLLENQNIIKPNYFGVGLIGAHISVIYPEENIALNESDLNQEHYFEINGVFSAVIEAKKYYVLMVNAPSLLQLRRKYGVSDMLPFKGYSVDFHITIGYSQSKRPV